MKRTPMQTLFVAFVVAFGLLMGTKLVAPALAGKVEKHQQTALPDITIVSAEPGDLEKYGYRFGAERPQTWHEISLREFQNDHGSLHLLKCQIAATEAAKLLAFPPDSRRGERDVPPEDWPWGAGQDPFRVLDWWKPQGTQSRIYEAPLKSGGWEGRFAVYDPTSQWLHVWLWRRSDFKLVRPDTLTHLVADELVSALAVKLLAEQKPSGRDPLVVTDLAPSASGIAAERFAASLTTIDAYLLPFKGEHRYFLALHGLDENAFRQTVGEVPLRSLPDDSPIPSAWSFALPTGSTAPPAWFDPRAGPRWSHCLVELGTGLVERGRWVAYDRARSIGFVWDWEGPGKQAAEADLNR